MCVAGTRLRGLLGLAVAILIAFAAGIANARAQPAAVATPPKLPSWETWFGAEASSHSWSLYSGLTYSPFDNIRVAGLRLRTVAGYGRYDYGTHRWTGTALVPQTVRGTTTFADALLGYQWSAGPLTIKAFGGIATEGHWLTPEDPYSSLQGVATGGRILIESWIDWTPQLWTSADLGWSSLRDGRSARLRTGYRMLPWLAVGLEAGYAGTETYEEARAGMFVRGEWASSEVSASVGVAGTRDGDERPYGTVNWLLRY